MSEIIVALLHYDFYDLSSSIIKLNNSKYIAGFHVVSCLKNSKHILLFY